MFSRDRDDHVNTTHETHTHTGVIPAESRTATVARGGLSLWSILTGVLVALGVMFLLSAIAGAVIVNTSLEEEIASGTVTEVGVGAIIAIAIAQFLSYLWGGYTAGRMARGSGFANGLMVPITALVIAGIVALITWGLGETTSLGLPFVENRLPTNNDALIDFGIAGGIATLVAMILGGILGGIMGARWHTKLERRAIADHDAKTIDIREGRTTTNEVPATTTTEHTHAHTAPVASTDEHTHAHTAPTATDTRTSEGVPVEHREPIHTRPASER